MHTYKQTEAGPWTVGFCVTRAGGTLKDWVGFTGPTLAQRSVLDWMYSWNQDRIGINRRLTLAS
jgi:hypothetical protein